MCSKDTRMTSIVSGVRGVPSVRGRKKKLQVLMEGVGER